MAVSKWSDLTKALNEWHEKRVEASKAQVRKDAEKLQRDIKQELSGTSNSKTAQEESLTAKTTVSPEAKQAQLSPSGASKKTSVSPIKGLDTYTNSIIIEDESSGTDTVVVVKLDEPSKKDETTGMEVVKIAKAIEFGTTKAAPRPAWRRSLKKIGASGVYKKKS